ncbi:MAG: histidine kinase, partial [Phormidesmis sp.]
QQIQNEKMASLGQLVAGVAHEINNPVNFIHGNIKHIGEYVTGLMSLIETYQEHVSPAVADVKVFNDKNEAVAFDFILED